MTYKHFQMKEVNIKGLLNTVQEHDHVNMVNHSQSQLLKNSNIFQLKHYYKFISILMTHLKVKNSHVFETCYKFKYPTHFQVRKIILKGKVDLVVHKMIMLTWPTMANSKWRIDINDSYTITRE